MTYRSDDLPGFDSGWEPAGPEPASQSICIADLEPQPVEWLWPGYIPAGMITIIDGDPGLGKSYLTCDLAARVSRGLPMPPHGGEALTEPAGVLLCNAEDDPARTIRPRLDALGANVSRVHLPDLRDGDERPRPIVLPDDLGPLEAIITRNQVALVVIDPLMAFLGRAVDAHKDSDIRRVLACMKDVAERTRAAIVIVRHLNKMVSVSDPLARGGGSIGIIGAARSGLMVGRHPDDERLRVLAPTKGNLSAPPPALAFRLDGGNIGWIGAVDLSASDLLGQRSAGRGRPADAVGEAKEWLADYLGNGERLADEVTAAAENHGISARTLRRASQAIGVVRKRPMSVGGHWAWELSRRDGQKPDPSHSNYGHHAQTQEKQRSRRDGQESANYGHHGDLADWIDAQEGANQ